MYKLTIDAGLYEIFIKSRYINRLLTHLVHESHTKPCLDLPAIRRLREPLSTSESFLEDSTGELRPELGYKDACHFSGSQTPSLSNKQIFCHQE